MVDRAEAMGCALGLKLEAAENNRISQGITAFKYNGCANSLEGAGIMFAEMAFFRKANCLIIIVNLLGVSGGCNCSIATINC